MPVHETSPRAVDLVNRLWAYCHVLRHDGVDYGDYIEQLAYLLFLKMADERGVELPDRCSWKYIKTLDENHLDEYSMILKKLAAEPGILGDVFFDARSRFTNTSSIGRLVDLIDQDDWSALGVDVQAAVFEGLLERAAAEGKKGAGQYFTPRPLIETMVRCIKPDPQANENFRIGDPACGTGGFLVSAYEWLLKESATSEDEITERVRAKTYAGTELVQRPRQLALMNLFLHGVSADIRLGDAIYGNVDERTYDVVLTNPPFGTKGASARPERPDFPLNTNNKQLNFLQHVASITKVGGRAAVVVPDNVLFGAQATQLFRALSSTCNFHTILRCPEGTFSPYTEGTKTNALFFTKGMPTAETWIYDARSGVPRLNKRMRPLLHDTFSEFEHCYGNEPDGAASRTPADSPTGRWRRFSLEELEAVDFRIASLKWLDDASPATRTGAPVDQIAELASKMEGLLDQLRLMHDLMSDSRRSE